MNGRRAQRVRMRTGAAPAPPPLPPPCAPAMHMAPQGTPHHSGPQKGPESMGTREERQRGRANAMGFRQSAHIVQCSLAPCRHGVFQHHTECHPLDPLVSLKLPPCCPPSFSFLQWSYLRRFTARRLGAYAQTSGCGLQECCLHEGLVNAQHLRNGCCIHAFLVQHLGTERSVMRHTTAQ